MECRLIEAGGGGRCSARWLELDAIAARLRRYLGDSDPGAYPIDFFLSRPEGFGARGAAAGAAFRRLSVEERDEVVAALAAEFSRRGSGRDCVAGTLGAVLFAVSHSRGGRIG